MCSLITPFVRDGAVQMHFTESHHFQMLPYVYEKYIQGQKQVRPAEPSETSSELCNYAKCAIPAKKEPRSYA